jgi:2-(1,2-epoxy-1,2-dihydrophenyl)acetyl-CoA isomerase
MPLVAAVNGPCAGAGMSLALACDIVVAARSASFLQAFCNIGLVPDAGSTYFLPRLVGRGRAAGLALLGEKIPAETALEWGMIWKVVDDEALMAEAGAIAKKLANGPTKGLSLIRQALDKSWSNDLATQLDVERNAQRIAGRTQDFAEGVAAFLQKRPARFQGR